jgi:ubiquinone/menaquinone biosynthesis C-methylase UbiE
MTQETFDPTKQYDKIGRSFIENKQRFFKDKPDLAKEFILAHLGEIRKRSLLDVGCGAGDDLKTYMAMGADCYGIDPSGVMIDEATKNTGLEGKLRVESAEKISFPRYHFDIIVGRFSLNYLRNMEKAYDSIARVMRIGAKGVFAVDHPLRSQALKKGSGYAEQELVTIHLYDGQVPLTFPSHTFTDYFSPTFFKHFNLKVFYEEMREFEGERKQATTPNFLGYVFTKK